MESVSFVSASVTRIHPFFSRAHERMACHFEIPSFLLWKFPVLPLSAALTQLTDLRGGLL